MLKTGWKPNVQTYSDIFLNFSQIRSFLMKILHSSFFMFSHIALPICFVGRGIQTRGDFFPVKQQPPAVKARGIKQCSCSLAIILLSAFNKCCLELESYWAFSNRSTILCLNFTVQFTEFNDFHDSMPLNLIIYFFQASTASRMSQYREEAEICDLLKADIQARSRV